MPFLSLSMNSHEDRTLLRVPVVGPSLLGSQGVHLVLLVLLCVALKNFLSQLWMINNNFLLSHVFNSIIMVALDRVIVLVDLYSQASNSGEVIWLWKMSKAMVLHSLQDVFHAHPLASLTQSLLARLWPDLIKTWHNEGSSGDLENHLELAANNLLGDLWLAHVEYLFSIHCPDIVHLLQASTVRGGESLDTCNLSSEGNILPSLNSEPPLLLEGVPLNIYSDHLLWHGDSFLSISYRSESSNIS